MKKQIKKDKLNKKELHSTIFLYLSIVFVVCLLLSNILAAKLLKIGPYSVTSGVLVFPISYIINDILAEVYGYKKAKKVIIFGFIMSLFMVIIFSLAIFLPAPVWFENSEAFKTILGSTPRIAFAGFVAYLLGSLANAKVLVKMKGNNESKFGIRAIVSTIAGEGIDSLIFVPISFFGTISTEQMLQMILIQVIIKTVYEIICLPLTTFVLGKVKDYEKNWEKKIYE